MKILFLTISSFSRFPVYKRAVGMGSELAKVGWTVYIAVEDNAENRSRFPLEAAGCVPLWFKPCNPLVEAWRKLKFAWNVKPDYLYSLSYSIRNLRWLSWLLPRKTEYVFEVCELYSAYKPMWKIVERMIMIEADRIVCASQYLRQSFERRIRQMGMKTPCLYLPYAYPKYLKPSAGAKKDAVVYMAYMSCGYGCFMIMEAFEKIAAQHPNVVLEMLGTGPDLEEMKNWVKEHCAESRVHLRGFVAEHQLNEYFSRALAFVAPLRNERVEIARCPSKLFYYLPYNKPIVTCKIGNPFDVLGEFGYYYEPMNVEDMAIELGRALRNTRGFAYPDAILAANTWRARTVEFAKWLTKENV